MTYEDFPCRNLFRECAIDSIYFALHKFASRNPNRNSGWIAAVRTMDLTNRRKRPAGLASATGRNSRDADERPVRIAYLFLIILNPDARTLWPLDDLAANFAALVCRR